MHSKISNINGLFLDDVSIVPNNGRVEPDQLNTKTRIGERFHLNIPLISSPRDMVSEAEMAIAMAHAGGLGIIHKNMPTGRQVEEVRKVKRAEAKIVDKPITVAPETPLAEAADLMRNFKISGIPVVGPDHKPVGILTNRDIRFAQESDMFKSAAERMSHEKLVTVHKDIEPEKARQLMYENRIEKLLVVDNEDKLTGLLTVKDLENMKQNPNATRDASGRLKVGAAVGTGNDGYNRAQALADAEVDIVVVDTPDAHQRDALDVVNKISQLQSSKIKVIAGNVLTGEGARALIDNGAQAIKVGCQGRQNGVSVPLISAVLDVVDACSQTATPVIVDGGIMSAADIAKMIAAGADAVMLDRLLAGSDEAPGDIVFIDGHIFKTTPNTKDFAGHKASYKGRVSTVLEHLMSGLRQAMVETASENIEALKFGTKFVTRHDKD